jgi:hypothetical protein
MKPYAHHFSNYRGFILVDIRNGVPPATRGAVTNDPNDPYWEIIDACWNTRPRRRPSVTELLRSLDNMASSKDTPSRQNTPSDSTAITGVASSTRNNTRLHVHERMATAPGDADSRRDARKVPLRARTLSDCAYTISVFRTLQHSWSLMTFEDKGDDPEELSFAKGEILEIIEKSTTWCRARKEDGTSGGERN